MPSNKDWLYVILYVRGRKSKMPGLEDMLSLDTYIWAFIHGPEAEADDKSGCRFHVRDRLDFSSGSPVAVWEFEERDIPRQPTARLLVRIMIR
ncbi:hypothetical protein P152DRAFT_499906 [Eremomyces bilateralis CBS 781.70]|uniref:Uncharacterized protein n=1 Tax=Eremomyces bilateralis CBS 781.70 TaxID=1392243 RepID=A0A6G1G8M1_9PEZI|nr:uncharacterized protein P152DRAFT_499906 [Eremomyces bilateralis CBS 781.70]KAF1814276.1 hypothetical protein P152DRAFT_499906 [Eremomyces bilateralis CBS 781.70]